MLRNKDFPKASKHLYPLLNALYPKKVQGIDLKSSL